jgi:hypothetical protein
MERQFTDEPPRWHIVKTVDGRFTMALVRLQVSGVATIVAMTNSRLRGRYWRWRYPASFESSSSGLGG